MLDFHLCIEVEQDLSIIGYGERIYLHLSWIRVASAPRNRC